MRKVILIGLLLIGVFAQAQENRRAKVILEVDGVCKMCKKRIEKVSYKTKGVKYANWNVRTHQLTLIIDERKTSVKEVQKNIANVGHDNIYLEKHKVIASDEEYDSLHECCKYRDEEVIKKHIKK